MRALAISLFIVVIAASYTISAQTTEQANPDGISDAYKFPLRPGMPEWKELKSHAEMLEACQIPDQLLANMSTEGLVRTCLTYPMAYDFLAFHSVARGINSVISRFNGLQELLRRPDAAVALLSAYKKMDPATTPDCGRVDKRPCRFQFMYVEMLLSQEPILSSLTKDEKRSLLEVCRAKYAFKQNDANYGMIHFVAIGHLMSNILLSAAYAPFQRKYKENADLRSFLDGAPHRDRDALDEIIASVDRYLETTVREEGKR
jgi:hypothetical protein